MFLFSCSYMIRHKSLIPCSSLFIYAMFLTVCSHFIVVYLCLICLAVLRLVSFIFACLLNVFFSLFGMGESWDNSRFSPVMWSKLTIITVQWIKSRNSDTIDDWYINNIAKNQVFAVFHSQVICKSVSPKFREFCMETPCLCPSEGHKYGSCKVTETSVTELCYRNKKNIALEILYIEINASSRASTV